MTFIYELDPYPVEIYRKCENELATLPGNTFESYRLTYIHTHTTKIIYHVVSRGVMVGSTTNTDVYGEVDVIGQLI